MPTLVRTRLSAHVRTLIYAGFTLGASNGFAQWQGEIGLEARAFTQSPADPAQHDASTSIDLRAEYYRSWDAGRQSFVFKPFLRLDQKDDERTHADIREAVWTYAGDDWEFRAGIDKVFWGVAESNHLVDIINSTDVIESADGEAKLGQPMLKYSTEQSWGLLDVYFLPWFREPQFADREGRLRTALPIDEDQAVIHTRHDQAYPAFAMRWSQIFGDWDVGLSHFHGISREPRLVAGAGVLIPHYDVINQTGLDLQATLGDWLWKAEAIYRTGQGDSYWAGVAGFEYTWVGIADSAADLGILLEASVDERGDNATLPLNNDLFLGLRWVANDVAGSEMLGGVVWDWENSTRFWTLEASRRLGNDWKVSLQARAWSQVAASDPLQGLSQDDYVELRLVRYF